ncbi:MAG: DNA-directed RNA polymerase subunit omega [Eubacteriales bacterium]|nr:DNA-directed RNA polymerase subunit omega [Eubacteriales bacterium]
MLHPAYSEILEKVNEYAEEHDFCKIDSRYTLVSMAYRRAHQIIEGDEPQTDCKIYKPLSKAVHEIYANKVNIVSKK